MPAPFMVARTWDAETLRWTLFRIQPASMRYIEQGRQTLSMPCFSFPRYQMYTTFGLDLNCEWSMNIGHPLAALRGPEYHNLFVKLLGKYLLVSLHHLASVPRFYMFGGFINLSRPLPLCTVMWRLLLLFSQVATYD